MCEPQPLDSPHAGVALCLPSLASLTPWPDLALLATDSLVAFALLGFGFGGQGLKAAVDPWRL